jgi:hypothetical protein
MHAVREEFVAQSRERMWYWSFWGVIVGFEILGVFLSGHA